MKKILSIFLLIVFLFSGCFTKRISETMQSWVGHHKSSLIQSWGPPSSISDDGKGGEIYIYNFNRNLNTTHTTTYNQYNNSLNTTSRNNSYTANRMFFINKDGNIYNWRWKGL